MELAALEGILSDILRAPNVVIAAGEPDAIAELEVRPDRIAIESEGGWVTVEGGGWHFHLSAGRVARLAFRRGPDVHDPSRESFHVSFKDAEGRSVLRAFFSDCYDDAGRLLESRIEPFLTLRERYGAATEGR